MSGFAIGMAGNSFLAILTDSLKGDEFPLLKDEIYPAESRLGNKNTSGINIIRMYENRITAMSHKLKTSMLEKGIYLKV